MNLLDRTKKYQQIQFKNKNIFEKKFYDVLGNLKAEFKPQWVIPPYIVDIAIPKKGLIIEIDGSIHNKKSVQMRDAQREEYLSSFGLIIIRYKIGQNETIRDFIIKTLKLFPDLKKRRYSMILMRINRVRTYLTNENFEIRKFKSYLQIRFKYISFRNKKRRLERFNEFCKIHSISSEKEMNYVKENKFFL